MRGFIILYTSVSLLQIQLAGMSPTESIFLNPMLGIRNYDFNSSRFWLQQFSDISRPSSYGKMRSSHCHIKARIWACAVYTMFNGRLL